MKYPKIILSLFLLFSFGESRAVDATSFEKSQHEDVKMDSLLYINEPVVDMRESPSSDSKVVSQAIFSERIMLLNSYGDWSYVMTPDQYSGWIPSRSIIAAEQFFDANLSVTRRAAHIYHVKDTEYGPVKTVPYGSRLQALDSSDSRWIKIALPDNGEYYIQDGDVVPQPPFRDKSDLVSFSQQFLGLPYTWGGRSSFGYDCSGFVQFLYFQIGIELQRDSKQQVADSRFQTISIDDLEPGDLIFFGKEATRIMHVGMSIGDGQFIHATSRENKPWIRISRLSDLEWNGNPKAYYPYREARKLFE